MTVSTRRRLRRLGVAFLIAVLVFFVLIHIWQPHYALQVGKCPACFGKDLCNDLTSRLSVKWWSYVRLKATMKGVTFASLELSGEGKKEVALKSLAFSSEMSKFDSRLCMHMLGRKDCNMQEAVAKVEPFQAFQHERNAEDFSLWNDGMNLSYFFPCPSSRFRKRLVEFYDENRDGHLSLDERRILLTTLQINPEPVYLRLFPGNQGWPFPTLYGACGRAVVVENAGMELTSVLKRGWQFRVWISIQLLDMAQLLSGHEGWAVYLLDYAPDNFAVTQDGRVICIDVEHVLVVNMQELNKQGPPSQVLGMNGDPACPHENYHCSTFNPESMCEGHERDHNYIYVCKNMLGFAGHGLLLHHSPADVRLDIEKLLRDCIYYTPRRTRVEAAAELKALLTSLLPAGIDTTYFKSEYS